METVSSFYYQLPGEELVVLNELLQSERSRLMVEIRHTDHRAFRDELRHRLEIVEHLLEETEIP